MFRLRTAPRCVALGSRCVVGRLGITRDISFLSMGFSKTSDEIPGNIEDVADKKDQLLVSKEVTVQDQPLLLEDASVTASESESTPTSPKILFQYLKEDRKDYVARNPLAIRRADSVSIEREQFLRESFANKYPRIRAVDPSTDSNVLEIKKKYEYLKSGEKILDKTVTIRGRITSARHSSSKLVFWDVTQDGADLQIVSNFAVTGGTMEDFHKNMVGVRVGDIVSVTGHIGRSDKGGLSVFATSYFDLLAPSLHVLPEEIQDQEKRFHWRHVDLLIRRQSPQILRLRSDVIQYIRNFLLEKDFTEVQTPILASNAGGAVARPFTTASTIFRSKRLALRIAPELWLKRLVIGGMERVFEIGPQFRNENADTIHNPEFTTVEFYQAYVGLEDLISMTEALLSQLGSHVDRLKAEKYEGIPRVELRLFRPFRRIEFIPALEKSMGRSLPKLDDADEATFRLRILFSDIGLELPKFPTLPRLLDRLSSVFLEPHCQWPTFITHHPECLAPLAKSSFRFGHKVSHRAELFICGREIVNAYEEENSPLEQRRKFYLQKKWKNEENSAFTGDQEDMAGETTAEEAYVGALEWGLPPTGGFGMGIDRLCMLFTASPKISEVLTFGGLRGVVGQGGVGLTNPAPKSSKIPVRRIAVGEKSQDSGVEPGSSTDGSEGTPAWLGFGSSGSMATANDADLLETKSQTSSSMYPEASLDANLHGKGTNQL